MCTVTSHLDGRRLVVTMNRDERRERGPEQPPVVHPAAAGAPAWVAPADSESGGTWMGANACGVVACLLNRYLPADSRPTPDDRRLSRGAIIPALLAQGGHGAARAWLETEFDPKPYPSFTLLVGSPDGRDLYLWPTEGGLARVACGPGWRLVSSSSWNTDAVLAWRRERFADWVAAGADHAGDLPTYNLLCPDGLAEWAPLMSRTYAATRGITQAVVDSASGTVTLRYWPEASRGLADASPATLAELSLTPPQ